MIRTITSITSITAITLLSLAGCATPDYKAQLATYEKVETNRSGEKKAKYDSLGAIASNASDATKQVALQAWQAVAMADSFSGGRKDYEPMPQAPETAFDKTLRALSIIAPVAANITGSVMSYKLGTNQAQYSRDIALGDQRARVDTVTAVTNGMGALGAAGLGAATTLGNRPTTVVNGNGNAVNGSAADNSTHNTNNCPGAAGGNGGNAGNGGSGGTNGAGGQSNAGQGAPSGGVTCAAGK